MQREKLNNCFQVNIFGNSLSPDKTVRNLGVRFDCDFTF